MASEFVSKVASYVTYSFDGRARLTGHSSDGRERTALNYVQQNAQRGNAEAVVSAIESFTDRSWMPILGREKGCLLDAAVQKFDPKVALEIGTYCGYSAIRIASKMTKPDSKLICIEMNPHNYAVATAMIEHAGLSSKVIMLRGTLSDLDDSLEEFLIEMTAPYFDFIFMDQFKDCYLPDFLLLQDKGMLGKGTGIVAESIGSAEAQNYHNYLKGHRKELETEIYTSESLLPCKMTVSTYIANRVNLVS
jgi:catechol O-methyltransferase